MVCVVFRAKPLIWPTFIGAPHAPRPLCPFPKGKSQTPGGFSSRGYECWCFTKYAVIPDGEADPGPPAAKSPEVPALRYAQAGMTLWDWRRILSGTPLPQALPGQRPCSSVGAQDGASRGTLRVSTKSINPLTHQLAQKELSGGFKASTAWLEPFLSERRLQRLIKAPDVAEMLDDLFW